MNHGPTECPRPSVRPRQQAHRKVRQDFRWPSDLRMRLRGPALAVARAAWLAPPASRIAAGCSASRSCVAELRCGWEQIGSRVIAGKVMSGDEAALIPAGATVGMSGFAGAHAYGSRPGRSWPRGSGHSPTRYSSGAGASTGARGRTRCPGSCPATNCSPTPGSCPRGRSRSTHRPARSGRGWCRWAAGIGHELADIHPVRFMDGTVRLSRPTLIPVDNHEVLLQVLGIPPVRRQLRGPRPRCRNSTTGLPTSSDR